MVTLKPCNPANFNITNLDNTGTEFIYYTFVKDRDGENTYRDSWNIVGVCHRQTPTVLSKLRLFHIEESELEAPDFQALRDARSYLSLNPDEFLALIQFFEEAIVESQSLSIPRAREYFALLDTEDLAQMHLKSYWITRWVGHCYRYLPDERVPQDEEIALLVLPYWSSQYGRNQRAALTLMTFRSEQLADPTFDPFDKPGVGSITLDQPALEALIDLMKQRTYERFISMFE